MKLKLKIMKVRIDQKYQKVKNIRKWELDTLINKINYKIVHQNSNLSQRISLTFKKD
jgi:hypothetical protein